MTKTRIENLSDAVFAIVFTLLIIEIHVPEFHHEHVTNWELWQGLYSITSLFISYYVSFIVLVMFWIAHHALFGFIERNINRHLILLNFFFLCMIAFVPFSSNLIGTYSETELAYVIYGLNILAIGMTNLAMLKYAVYSKDIDTTEVSPRLFRQAKFRFVITPLFALIGIIMVFINLPLALIFFAFPILFNIIPGGVNYLERKFRLNFG
ncbi:MAG: TMEM175 family protein [Candidatus Moranbacteria bacterium]|jgi:uncharacterized membrane protein|nr:TMEM175 family protein [Candidatus Moranbacteria bacterium]